MNSQKSWMRAFLQMVLVNFHLVRHTKPFSIKAAYAVDADTRPGGFWIPDFWCLFVIYMCDKNWNSVRRPWCAHTESPIFPLEVEWQMLHTCAVRWKQKVRYFLCMHLHICFKLKYLFSQCIGTNIPEHNTKPFMNLSCTRFESNRHLQRFRRATEHRNKRTCNTEITKKLPNVIRSQVKTHTNTLYVCEALHLCTHIVHRLWT